MISNLSRVIVAKKLKTLDQLKAEMVEKFGSFKKEELSPEKATEAYTYLRSII